jgi:uncharacterized protein YggE
MSNSRFSAIALAFAFSLAGAAGPARGQVYNYGALYTAGGSPNMEGITVAGKSTVMARPNLVEIDLSVSASSELSADAIVKYRDARRKLRDAFTALKLGNVALEERGLKVDSKGSGYSPYFFDYSPNTRTKTEVQLTRKLVVRGNDIRKMDEDAVLQLVAKLLDVAQDAGGHVGPEQQNDYYYWRWGGQSSSLVRFVVEDFDKLKEEAYEKAVADARARAERLARLGKVELGPILAISEVAVPGDTSPGGNPYYGDGNPNADDEQPNRKRLVTSKLQEVPVRVELMVRFGVISKPNAKARSTER